MRLNSSFFERISFRLSSVCAAQGEVFILLHATFSCILNDASLFFPLASQRFLPNGGGRYTISCEDYVEDDDSKDRA